MSWWRKLRESLAIELSNCRNASLWKLEEEMQTFVGGHDGAVGGGIHPIRHPQMSSVGGIRG